MLFRARAEAVLEVVRVSPIATGGNVLSWVLVLVPGVQD
jgi:hypothetical protein